MFDESSVIVALVMGIVGVLGGVAAVLKAIADKKTGGGDPGPGTPAFPVPEPRPPSHTDGTAEVLLGRLETIISAAEASATHEDVAALEAKIDALSTKLDGVLEMARENSLGVDANRRVNVRQDVQIGELIRATGAGGEHH